MQTVWQAIRYLISGREFIITRLEVRCGKIYTHSHVYVNIPS